MSHEHLTFFTNYTPRSITFSWFLWLLVSCIDTLFLAKWGLTLILPVTILRQHKFKMIAAWRLYQNNIKQLVYSREFRYDLSQRDTDFISYSTHILMKWLLIRAVCCLCLRCKCGDSYCACVCVRMRVYVLLLDGDNYSIISPPTHQGTTADMKNYCNKNNGKLDASGI